MKLSFKKSAPVLAVIIGLIFHQISLRASPESNISPNKAADSIIYSPPDKAFGKENVTRLHQFLNEVQQTPEEMKDFYFVVIGDIQNTVRSFRHHIFESICADIQKFADEETGQSLYDRIKFVVLLGDMVYEGPSFKQWSYLERAFAGQDPDGLGYPNIKKIVSDKPIFPVLGNHEIFRFRLFKPQNRYRDYSDSPNGVLNFKRFFEWDKFIRNPNILYSVPADLDRQTFKDIFNLLDSAEDRKLLTENYALSSDQRMVLKFLHPPPADENEYEKRAKRLASSLAPVFNKAGYGVLPVISSDNMIYYAFEAGGVLYLMLDSMARGWQYPAFSKLKQTIYQEMMDQHRLNLFTPGVMNGQGWFFKAALDYAQSKNLRISVMMHHSAFNNSKPPTAPGTPFAMWMALGLPLKTGGDYFPTIFDDIFFSPRITHIFTACVHGYETFDVIAREHGQTAKTLRWTISGGGGGPMRRDYYEERLMMIADFYKSKLDDDKNHNPGRSIEVVGDTTAVGHQYLIVRVQDGQIAEIIPRFIRGKAIIKPHQKPVFSLTPAYYSRPATGGLSLSVNPGVWGMEGLFGFLTFANWKPYVSAGTLIYEAAGSKSTALNISLSPFNLELHAPGSNIISFEPAALEIWTRKGGNHQLFLRTGFEMPIIFNLTGKLQNLSFGIKFLAPLWSSWETPALERKTRWMLTCSYSFRL